MQDRRSQRNVFGGITICVLIDTDANSPAPIKNGHIANFLKEQNQSCTDDQPLGLNRGCKYHQIKFRLQQLSEKFG